MLRMTCILTLLGIVLPAAAADGSVLELKWKNQSRNDLIVSEKGSTVQIEVKKRGKFDGSAAAELRQVPRGPTVFCGTVRSSRTGIAYLQVKLYRDGKELNRFSSSNNRDREEELHVQFDPKGAERVELLCRTVSEPESVGATVQFSNFQLLPAAEFRRRLPAEKVTPGYEACSIELNHRRAADYGSFQSEVSYRPAGEKTWISALPLAYLPEEKSARGSLFNLKENTAYELRIFIRDGGKTETLNRSFRTLSSRVPIARTVELGPETRLPLTIRGSGSPDGYIRYTAKPGVVLDAGTKADNVIRVDRASYIILDGLTLRGGRLNGIRLDAASHVQILNCDISGFEWSDEKWLADRAQTDWSKRPVSVYEVHLGSWKRVPEDGFRPLAYAEIGTQLAEYCVEMGFTHVEFLPLSETHAYRTRLIRFKGVNVRGFRAPVRITAPEAVHRMIWSTGLGALNSGGWGLMELGRQ